MLLAAYLALVAAVWWMSSGRSSWAATRGPAGQRAVRVGLAAAAALLGAAGWVLIWKSEGSRAGLAGALLISGSAVYIAGLVLWRGRTAYAFRFAGWLTVTAPLAVPSTLTLALPIAALLAVSLTEVGQVRPRPAFRPRPMA